MGNYEDDYKKLLDERDRSAPTSHPVMGTDRLLDVNEEMAADFAISSPVVHTERREDRHVEKSERADTRSGGYRAWLGSRLYLRLRHGLFGRY